MNKKMCTEANIDDPDDFYARLIALHQDLDSDQSQAVNAKLILLMANQIGDRKVLNEILLAASTAQTAAE